MSFAIKDHKLVNVPWMPAKATGRVITPEILVLHDTAGRDEKGSSAEYLATHDVVSAQLVLELDGTLTQLVQFNHKANHAGVSEWRGRQWCNGFSIGIEIVNPGKMTDVGNGKVKPWFDEFFDKDAHPEIKHANTSLHGDGWWLEYTQAQLDTLFELVPFLVREYGLVDIVRHCDISPGRKIDVNPLFPIEKLRAHVFGRDLEVDQWADKQADEQTKIVASDFGTVNTPNNDLTLRRWPGFQSERLHNIPHGSVVPINRSGRFPKDAPECNQRLWHNVTYGGETGWVIARLITEDSLLDQKNGACGDG